MSSHISVTWFSSIPVVCSQFIITISMIQKRDAKIVVTPIFNMIWVTLKRRIIIEQIKPHLYRFGFFFFKTTLKFEDSMILVTLSETWMWIKRWNLWRRCAAQCDAIQVRRCHFIQCWNLGDFTMWGRRLVCETAFVNLEMKTTFFHEVSLLLILSTYIYFLCAGSQMKYIVCYCTYFAMYIFP